MRTIAFVTKKGGAGKSTLASSIAVAAHAAGERAFIVDLDPMRTLVKWSKARRTADVPVEYVPSDKLPAILAELEESGVSLVVIDAPGADLDRSEEAIRAADLCIIPARPNIFDIWAGEATRIGIRNKMKDCAFLLNQCPPTQQALRVQRSAKALQEIGALLAPLISARVDYQEAARLGLGVSEFNPNGVAAREIRELWEAVARRLEQGENRLEPVAEEEIEPVVEIDIEPPAQVAASALDEVEIAPLAEAEVDPVAAPPEASEETEAGRQSGADSDRPNGAARPLLISPFWPFWQSWV
jgi:chromosome partitioning protein